MKTKIYSKLGLKLVSVILKHIFILKDFIHLMGFYIYQVCAGAHRGQSEKDMKFPDTRIIGSCEALVGVGK